MQQNEASLNNARCLIMQIRGRIFRGFRWVRMENVQDGGDDGKPVYYYKALRSSILRSSVVVTAAARLTYFVPLIM